MRKIKEVLRLRFELGLGLRAIARSCSLGLGTAHEYLQRPNAGRQYPRPIGSQRPPNRDAGRFDAQEPGKGKRVEPIQRGF